MKFLASIFITLVALLLLPRVIFAVAPSFPSCTSQTTSGDWVHSDHGFHHIPGQESTIEGSDDVYFLSGNFLQCLCAVDDTKTTQTVWWNITSEELSQEEIASYISNGWYLVNGSDWNLIQGNQYLAQNTNYSCKAEDPGRGGSSLVSDKEARCTGIDATPESGTAHLTVKFAASGYDSDGTIKEYYFDFGNNSANQPQRVTTKFPEATHRYEIPGIYTAKVEVLDSRGVWHGGNSECEVEIVVKAEPQVQVLSISTELPATGVTTEALLIGTGLGFVGIRLIRRFKQN